MPTFRRLVLAVIICLFGANTVTAQAVFENDEDALLHVNAFLAFQSGCLEPAPDFSEAFASFLSVGMKKGSDDVFKDEAGRLAAFHSQSQDGTKRSCSVALVDGNIMFFRDNLRKFVKENWGDKIVMEEDSDTENSSTYMRRTPDNLGRLIAQARYSRLQEGLAIFEMSALSPLGFE